MLVKRSYPLLLIQLLLFLFIQLQLLCFCCLYYMQLLLISLPLVLVYYSHCHYDFCFFFGGCLHSYSGYCTFFYQVGHPTKQEFEHPVSQEMPTQNSQFLLFVQFTWVLPVPEIFKTNISHLTKILQQFIQIRDSRFLALPPP